MVTNYNLCISGDLVGNSLEFNPFTTRIPQSIPSQSVQKNGVAILRGCGARAAGHFLFILPGLDKFIYGFNILPYLVTSNFNYSLN